LRHNATADEPARLATAVLSRKQPDVQAFTRALAQLHTSGTAVDWAPWFPVDPAPQPVDLPTYAFQRERYWLTPDPGTPTSASGGHGDGNDTAFWDAVEREDVEALSRTLGSPAEQRPVLGELLPTLSAWLRQDRERSVLASWRYQSAWLRLPEPARPALQGTWLVLAPADGEGADHPVDHPAVRTALRALSEHGAEPLLQSVSTAGPGREALARQLREATAGTAPAGILSLLPLDETAHPGHPELPGGLAATTVLLQALDEAGLDAPLWCLTQGAVAVSATDPLTSPAQAQTWGLGRVAALEHPHRWG
ncbi:polyketide synthase, partial [Streptomyces sp. SB3404]|nr:polyketide synthase [Streptomyces boncukensis]